MNLEKELKAAIEVSKIASEKIMEIYKKGFDVEIKDDDSPVTIADKTSDKIIREYLGKLFPSYSFLTEESVDNKARLKNDFCWVIDPLDGTCDYVAKDDEFTVNIALVYKHDVVLGVVAIPAKNDIYYAVKDGGAYMQHDVTIKKIHVNNKVKDLTCLTSVFHFEDNEKAMVKKHSDKITKVQKIGSSLKACYIAEGKAEISYRLSEGTKEWDTAAFQILVEEAGGLVLKPDGKRMLYNREDVKNHEGYVIMNNKENFLL
ncbi:MAG: 3'(2'),5'-bisphosphate nucleotidase CysQ [Bacilli bacterium]